MRLSVLSKLFQRIVGLVASRFLVTHGAVNGSLIYPELKKAAIAALAASSVVGGLLAGLNSLQLAVPLIFPDPLVGSLVTMILTYVGAQIALYGTGDPKPAIPSVPPGSEPTPPADAPTSPQRLGFLGRIFNRFRRKPAPSDARLPVRAESYWDEVGSKAVVCCAVRLSGHIGCSEDELAKACLDVDRSITVLEGTHDDLGAVFYLNFPFASGYRLRQVLDDLCPDAHVEVYRGDFGWSIPGTP